MIILEIVPYIHYSVHIWKRGKKVTRGLIDPSNEVNAMIAAYGKQLDLQIRQNNVGVQKIDGSSLETFKNNYRRLPGRRQARQSTIFLRVISISWNQSSFRNALSHL